jgi:hypothetical protein
MMRVGAQNVQPVRVARPDARPPVRVCVPRTGHRAWPRTGQPDETLAGFSPRVNEIVDIIREGHGTAELYLEWDVAA